MSIQSINQYITEINKIYRAGNATEHSYRPALKTLFENLTKGLTITNEPKHIECGAPDYIITLSGIPVGYTLKQKIYWKIITVLSLTMDIQQQIDEVYNKNGE